MNNKIYIAGRITGDPHYRAKFKSAEAAVKDWRFFDRHGVNYYIRHNHFGFVPVNPTEFTLLGHDLAECRWSLAMVVCLCKLVRCSYVYMLKDWKQSKGASVEHRWAKFLGKEIIYQ